jgi:hypothetical protein
MGKIQKENEKENKLKPVNIKVKTKNGETVIIHFGRSEQLGAEIVHFSIPRFITCIAYTPWCNRFCYARTGRHIYPSVRKARNENLALTLRDDFADIMTKAITKLNERGIFILRLHEEGDFYNEDYITKWIEIVKRLRAQGNNTIIYAYTRVWRINTLLPYLEELRSLPNVRIIASTDYFTGPPPKDWIEAGINFAYNKPAIMCLSDQGKVSNCSQCKLCINGRVNIYFNVPKAEL